MNKTLTLKAIKSYFADVAKAEAKAGLKTLKGTRKLLTPAKAWAKNGFNSDDYGLETGQFCLIGATEEVDGPGEYLADRLLMYAIGDPLTKPDLLDVGGLDEDEHKESSTNYLIDDVGGTRVVTDSVQDYNDDRNTTHKDILKLLDRCIGFAEKLIEVAPKKLAKGA